MPQHQEVGELSFEGAASRWTTAQEALTDFRTGAHQLMPPTWAQFRSLSAVGSVDEALTSASLGADHPAGGRRLVRHCCRLRRPRSLRP